MSSPPITVGIVVDSVQAQLAIKDVMDQADIAVRDWQSKRAQITTGIRQATTLIASLMSSFRGALSLIGDTMDPFFSALIGMVLSTVSMLLSIGAGLVGTGIGSAAGAVVLGIAVGIQVLQTAKLAADQAGLTEEFRKMKGNLAISLQGRTPANRRTGFGF